LLVDWLAQQEELAFCTRNLSQQYPEAKAFIQQASGLLSVRWSKKTTDGIIWFRPEEQQYVHWAGNPNKPVEVSLVGDEVRLTPRGSFALWKEASQGQSRRWLDCELDYANDLSQAVFTAIVERATVFAHHNAELERSNMELDAFAYAASHDLKEPLRGIHNFAELLKIEYEKVLPERGMQRIDTILGLVKRMDNLLESLLRYSRIGLTDLDLQNNAIEPIAVQTIEVFKQAYPKAGVTFTVQTDLPVLACDRMRVDIIFSNLILNASKYNDKTKKTVDIGCDVSVEPPVFYVRDNGIGIHADFHAFVFQLFRRLHNSEEFGVGNGTGLTIVLKAVKRHGGRIWLDSSPGLGSTFYSDYTGLWGAPKILE
jgi:light-regulated signal transduction histidine kinase (bacteriophytochrome)